MSKRKIGRFRIPSIMVEKEPEVLAQALKLIECIPLRVEHMAYSFEYEYVAICNCFPEKEQCDMIPEYVLEITQTDSGFVELVEAKDATKTHS